MLDLGAATGQLAMLVAQVADSVIAMDPEPDMFPDHATDTVILSTFAFSQVTEWIFERKELRSGDSIVGEIVSSTSGALDSTSVSRLSAVLEPFLADGALQETVTTTALIAKRPTPQ